MAKYQIWLSLGAFALLVLIALVEDAFVLTKENFEKEVGQDRGALIEFYAPGVDTVKSLLQTMKSWLTASGKPNLF